MERYFAFMHIQTQYYQNVSFPNLAYKFSAIPIEFSACYFVNTKKLIFNVYMERQNI